MRVIKPPEEFFASGKVFQPSKAFRNKLWLQFTIIATIIWLGTVVSWSCVSIFTIWTLEPGEAIPFFMDPAVWFIPVNIGMIVLNLIWLIPTLLLIPYYVSKIKYSVITESGETLPEVYVRKGIIKITRKHVPFRTITNISTTAGPFDRIFGIGNVNVETAGYSGRPSPEEKLEGFPFYEEVRDFILNELRKFKTPYTTATEISVKEEEIPSTPRAIEDKVLVTLLEMKELLSKIEYNTSK